MYPGGPKTCRSGTPIRSVLTLCDTPIKNAGTGTIIQIIRISRYSTYEKAQDSVTISPSHEMPQYSSLVYETVLYLCAQCSILSNTAWFLVILDVFQTNILFFKWNENALALCAAGCVYTCEKRYAGKRSILCNNIVKNLTKYDDQKFKKIFSYF